MNIRPGTPSDHSWAAQVITKHFATPQIVSRGVLHDTRLLPCLIAEEGAQPLGLAHYHITGARCEVVTLVALTPRQGVGGRLIREMSLLAARSGCRLLWVITTNDNEAAQRFFEALGWRLVAIHRRALDRSRQLKPEIPDRGAHGTLIEDELEFRMMLESADG